MDLKGFAGNFWEDFLVDFLCDFFGNNGSNFWEEFLGECRGDFSDNLGSHIKGIFSGNFVGDFRVEFLDAFDTFRSCFKSASFRIEVASILFLLVPVVFVL